MPSHPIAVSSSGSALPAPLTPLLGRSRALEATSALLDSPRMLTITGAGGGGDTRLALELAHRMASRFEEGAMWVDLAPLADADLIPQQILNAIGIREVATADVM